MITKPSPAAAELAVELPPDVFPVLIWPKEYMPLGPDAFRGCLIRAGAATHVVAASSAALIRKVAPERRLLLVFGLAPLPDVVGPLPGWIYLPPLVGTSP